MLVDFTISVSHNLCRLYLVNSSASGHSRPIHSAPLPADVRCASNSDRSRHESELTLSAKVVPTAKECESSYGGHQASDFIFWPPMRDIGDVGLSSNV